MLPLLPLLLLLLLLPELSLLLLAELLELLLLLLLLELLQRVPGAGPVQLALRLALALWSLLGPWPLPLGEVRPGWAPARAL